MKPRYQATKAAIELIKRFEGFRRRAAQLPDGGWTIGYGHTRTARAGVEITESDAAGLLIYDLAAVITAINEWVYTPLSQNQFDALAAFAFNIGLPNFRRSSVLRRLNEGSHLQAACAMEMWRTADFEGERIVIDALVRRRSAEMALFLTPQDGYVPVPSLIVMPRVDDEVARGAPLSSAEVETSLEDNQAKAYRTDEPAPSAGMAAADAVSARLNAILLDHGVHIEDKAPAAPLQPLPPEVEPAPPPVVEAIVEAPVVPVAPQAVEMIDVIEAPEPAPPTPSYAALQPSPIAFTAMSAIKVSGGVKHRARTPEPVLALIGLIGLTVFAAGIFWGFNAKASERLPLLADPATAGWGLGLAGIALAGCSIYFLLSRLAGKGE